MRPFRSATTGFLLLAVLGSCGEELSREERVLLERQKFEVDLLSWAPLPQGEVALDLEISVRGRSELDQLTVEVQQVDGEEKILRAGPLSLDVAGMGFDDRRLATARVPLAAEEVAAVAILLENVPEASKRADYPEFSADGSP